MSKTVSASISATVQLQKWTPDGWDLVSRHDTRAGAEEASRAWPEGSVRVREYDR